MFEMSSFEIVVTLIITVIAYMGFPFYKFCLSKGNYNFKFKKKVIFLNSVIVAILFTLIRIILNGTDDNIVNFAPAFTYYCINTLLYARKKDENVKEEFNIDEVSSKKIDECNVIANEEPKKDKTVLIDNDNNRNLKTNKISKNQKLVYLIIICITIVTSIGIFSYSNYKKEQLKQEQENKRLEKEQKLIETNQKKLSSCISQAKSNRSNLYDNNCTKQPDGRCTLSNNLITRIEQRYEQDLNNCYQLYGN